MKQFFQDVKNSFLLSAAVSIILGIVLIVYPVKTSLLICYIAGALLLFSSVSALSTAAFPILSPPTTWAAQNAGSKTSSRPRSTSRKSCTMTM